MVKQVETERPEPASQAGPQIWPAQTQTKTQSRTGNEPLPLHLQ